MSFDSSADIDLPGVNKPGHQNTTGTAAKATTLETARTIGGVSFDGSQNIDLPGVNIPGHQNTTGTAAKATQLETPRDFSITGDVEAQAVCFDGTHNVELTATLSSHKVKDISVTSPITISDSSGTYTIELMWQMIHRMVM